MKTTIRTIAVIAAVAALSACSSFKLGAACYIPHGVTGQCSATTVAPAGATQSQQQKPHVTGV